MDERTEQETGYEDISEFDAREFITRMSPESLIIFEGTNWKKRGFAPSFQETDKVLMAAARRTYDRFGSGLD